MLTSMRVTSDQARTALAAVRLVNGALALVAPEVLLRRLGTDVHREPTAVYPFRMFGIRTVLVGADLLLLHGEQRDRAVRAAILIHASDTLCALVAGVRRELPPRVAGMTTLISAVNTVLAVLASRGPRGTGG